ncbi:MAG TPA: hypothetical protein VEY88_21330 [Archangium sp.]|nr:hypothetical protein [Archangium sp.]
MARKTWERMLQGLGAGALGTLALTALEPLRDTVLGHAPPYAVRHLAARGAKRWLGLRLGPREAQGWGLVMRWVYGPTLGALHAWLRPLLPQARGLRGWVLGGGVWLFEWLALPRLGVTPPPHRWSSRERRLLLLQTSLFGLVTEAVLSRAYRGGREASRT